MTSLQRPKANRRWTFTGIRAATGEVSSEEDYGEEILPSIDQEALATLPATDQEKFVQMRKRDKKNVLARWRRERKLIPESSNLVSSRSIEPLVGRSSSVPQLPELQMDVPRELLISAVESARQSSDTINSNQRGRHPLTPRLALYANAPSASERAYAQTLTSVNREILPPAPIIIPDGVAAAHPDADEGLLVQPTRSIRQEVSPVRHWQEQAQRRRIQPSPPPLANSEQGVEQRQERAKASPIKRMARKIKEFFKSRGQSEEVRVETAIAITITSVAAPQPSQAQYLPRLPPPLQPAPAAQSARTGSSNRRTTRAMMENYS
ncbi:MAG: hypothetical protein Q9170_005193 [Blastenia crenularia]